jgi:hypothetical protein
LPVAYRHEEENTAAPSSASRPQGRIVPASEESAYRVPAGLQPDSAAHDSKLDRQFKTRQPAASATLAAGWRAVKNQA